MDDKLIVVRQLPVIEERLLQIKEQIQERVAKALALECTEATVKTIKQERSALNNDFKQLEDSRKEVKKAILSPYEQFEVIYKDCVTDVFKPADDQLRSRIEEVENGLKEQRKADAVAYFNEYAASKGIDFLSFNQAEISVTLSVSKKALKTKAKAFVDKVVDDLALIDTQEHKAEILVEYKKTLNASRAITTVSERMKAIEAERIRAEQIQAAAKARAEAAQTVEQVVESTPAPAAPMYTAPSASSGLYVPFTPPVAVADPPPEEAATSSIGAETADSDVLQVTFTVTATREKLRALRTFLVEGGYDYQ